MKEFVVEITTTLTVHAEDFSDLHDKVSLAIKESASDFDYDVIDERDVTDD